MKWTETIASRCRYGELAGEVFGKGEVIGDSDVIWEDSEDDYQGHANILVHFPDTGRFAHYEWTYGSCSGCDDWEARELSDEQIIAEMRESAAWFNDVETLKRYLRLDGEFENPRVPTAQPATAGSIPGMLRVLCGGVAREFHAMGDAFVEWERAKSAGVMQ